MNLLLDTHVFLWWDRQDKALNADTRAVIADPGNQIFVSAASIWEIAIKRRLRKLDFRGSAVAAIGANGFLELPCCRSTRRTRAHWCGNTTTRSTACWSRRRGA